MNVSNEILTSTDIRTTEAGSNSLARTVRAFIVLAKPEITFMVMISAGVASVMASGSVQATVLVHSSVGIGLLAAGASALNQYFERELDGKMRRTARRPLPAGELSARQAFVFGVVVSFCGALYLLLLLNPLTALLGLLTLVSYLFVYTPLKTKTPLCTLLGAFPGAAPMLMGWSAATNSLNREAWVLFAILFVWQFPHFYAIGWLYREDYARVGMRMLPSADDERTTFQLILISTHVLIVTSLLFTFVAHLGLLYFVPAAGLGVCFYHFAHQASVSKSKLAAKRLLHASVIYLPLLYLFMILDRTSR